MTSDLLTPSELCSVLKISRSTYARLLAQGLPPAMTILTSKRYRLAEVEAWLQRQAQPVGGRVGRLRPVRVDHGQLLDLLKREAKIMGGAR